MANTKIIFYDNDDTELECFVNHEGRLYLSIEGDMSQHITLDKSTAIKFSKTLRTEISKMEDE